MKHHRRTTFHRSRRLPSCALASCVAMAAQQVPAVRSRSGIDVYEPMRTFKLSMGFDW